ncbi:ABC transporter ATP-binding protein [Klebsiella sp. BIGb0407]|uniref:ABC transporter ATP-binding protein n=1 Tax=Klebsiella sp. BIGb0407 TaxID=2940603 RepID=UPI002166D689|nr:ABC transporter ATP-binding protein [Klebsiella sp. BIGb0407]MCS3430123.1 peptide/nickel transport system ATP-binding protein [Klebsiella sp. BIGb0407]
MSHIKSDAQPLLQITGLSIALPASGDREFALSDLSLNIARNEIVCVVGESGSGKSMTASAIMGLLADGVQITQGSIQLEETNLLALSQKQMRKVRGPRIGMIFQEPMTALNPLKRIGRQIEEMLCLHLRLSSGARRKRVIQLLDDVHIASPDKAYMAYPHQLSGGQRQRAMIAMAMALEPDLLIADEPTTALDVTTQAQILKLIRELQQRNGTGVLFITHDFGVVADIADRVVVLKQGHIVEQGSAGKVLGAPEHSYTRALINAVPSLTPPAYRTATSAPPLLSVSDIKKTFGKPGFFGRGRVVHALQGIDFSVAAGRSIGIVGESGSGKSTLARTLVRLTEPDSGKIHFGNLDYTALSSTQLRQHAGEMQMVFQDPWSSLNPRRTVGELISQPLTIRGIAPEQARERVLELLELVGLDVKAISRFPHEFSGGQRQRIGIARALALHPKILIADEAVSALDVSIQAQILQLLIRLRDELGLAIVLITHDLRVTAQVCDDLVVMKSGKIVESGPTADVFARPQHEYTRLLLSSVPGKEKFYSTIEEQRV